MFFSYPRSAWAGRASSSRNYGSAVSLPGPQHHGLAATGWPAGVPHGKKYLFCIKSVFLVVISFSFVHVNTCEGNNFLMIFTFRLYIFVSMCYALFIFCSRNNASKSWCEESIIIIYHDNGETSNRSKFRPVIWVLFFHNWCLGLAHWGTKPRKCHAILLC